VFDSGRAVLQSSKLAWKHRANKSMKFGLDGMPVAGHTPAIQQMQSRVCGISAAFAGRTYPALEQFQ